MVVSLNNGLAEPAKPFSFILIILFYKYHTESWFILSYLILILSLTILFSFVTLIVTIGVAEYIFSEQKKDLILPWVQHLTVWCGVFHSHLHIATFCYRQYYNWFGKTSYEELFLITKIWARLEPDLLIWSPDALPSFHGFLVLWISWFRVNMTVTAGHTILTGGLMTQCESKHITFTHLVQAGDEKYVSTL